MIRQLFKQVLRSINLFIAIGLLLGILAIYVSPQKLAFPVIFSQAIPYFLILNFIACLFWIILKRRYFLISAFCLIISLPSISDAFQIGESKAEKNKSTFKLLCYNVRVFDLYNWSHNKATRNKIFKFIRDENPEIACFQEFFNNNGSYFPVHDSLMQNQKFKYSHNYYNVEIKNGHQFGIATYSIYPIVNKEEIVFKETHNLAISTDICIDNDTIRIINCHLESVRFLATDYHFMDSLILLSEKRRVEGFKEVTSRLLSASIKRAQQAKQINELANKSPYPVIICGDFNDTPYSFTYKTISQNMHDSFKKHKTGIGGTYNRFFPPLRIDFILHNNKIQCQEFHTIKNLFSDHYPISGHYNIIQ